MQITCVAVSLALAASTANALPWGKSHEDCANAAGVNADTLDTTRDIHGKGSPPDSMHHYMKISLSSNQPHESADNNQQIQKKMMKEDLTLDASQKMFLDHEHDINPGLTCATSADKQSEEMTSLTGTQGSVASYGSNNMPAVQQNAMEVNYRGAAKDTSRSENNLNFAVRARGVFRSFDQAWDQRAKLGHGEQQQEPAEHMVSARQDRSEVFMSANQANRVNGQRQQATNSMSRGEKIREVRNHESCDQMPDSESADAHAEQSAVYQNHNYARSHMDGSDVQADETKISNQQSLDEHQEQVNMRETKYSHQQQQMQQQMPEHVHEQMLQQNEEQADEQMQQQMQGQMQPRSEAAEDLQSVMDNFRA